jgi:predicted TIM-barrel fold metal-dependent hydrolase
LDSLTENYLGRQRRGSDQLLEYWQLSTPEETNTLLVDCHSHVWAYPGHLSDEFVNEANARSRGFAMDLHVPPERHREAMRGVDKVIVFGMRAFHSGLCVPNDYVAGYAASESGKVIGFGAVDPSGDPVQETLEEIVHLGLRGVKLGPIYQNIDPLDPGMLQVYAFCQEHRLPILIHQGTTFVRTGPLRYALPILLDEVAIRFPRLKMIIAHLGHPWIAETLVTIRKHPNLFSDVSALHYRPWQFYNALIMAKEYGVLDKILFGSDYPFTTPEAQIEGLRNINRFAEGTNLPRLSSEEIEGIIYSPTLRLLGLEGA